MKCRLKGIKQMMFNQFFQHSNRMGGDKKGFTLVEVMIALFIFSIGILGLTKMQITGIQTNDIAGKYTEGSSWGVAQIETLMATAYDNAALDDNATGTDTDGIYTMNWTVTENDPVSNVKRINIIVTWKDRSFTADYYKAVSY